MTQDIIATPSRGAGAMVRPDDAWASGQSTTALGQYNPARPSPLRIVHRLLRGRVLLAIILSLAGAIAGGFYGYSSTTPTYEAEGVLEVAPYFITSNATEKVQGYFLNFVKSVPAKVRNTRTAIASLNREEWKSVSKRGPTPEFVGVFLNNLTVEQIRDTFNLRVSYEDSDPRVATAAVNAVLAAFAEQSRQQSNTDRFDDLNRINELYNKASTEYRRLQDVIINLSAEYGTDKLETLLEARQKKVLDAEAELRRAEASLELATSNKTVEGKDMPALTPEDLGAADDMMRYFLDYRAKAALNLSRLSRELGPNHPNVQRALREYQDAARMVEDHFQANKDKILDLRANVDGGGGSLVVTPRIVEQLKQVVAIKRKTYEAEKLASTELAKKSTEIRRVRDELDRAKEDMIAREKAKTDLEFRLAGTGQISITAEASLPVTPSKDRRKQLAIIGTVFGGGLPLGVLLLIGLLDSRYRYSEETTETSMTGLTLLGILPNLPDRLSDPGQASIAAHCVHQVRTRLQIDAPVDGPVAYAVTSASSGDGKTSLTLALGLSFAASGSRTLLIDCDLVGAGLTARLSMTGPEGILDAITTRDLMRFVKNTDVNDLMMLPAGNAQLQHAGVFSPNAIKRLLSEARKHFDIILIDTGPILGSIEATPVCAAVDGTILTVARGQQRPLVEKALSHLRSIGARMAGVVFNRAQARDFEQSISGISLRSATRSQNGGVGASNGHRDPGQYGSLAKAVATSVRGENTDG